MTDGRDLSDEEKALWDLMTKDITPVKKDTLRSTQDKSKKKKEKQDDASFAKGRQGLNINSYGAKKGAQKQSAPQEASRKDRGMGAEDHSSRQLDGRNMGRLKKGKITIDATLDLHGMNQAQAHARLNRFVSDARERGLRCLLVITGRGQRDYENAQASADPFHKKGILRKNLPIWLAQEPLKSLVLQYKTAKRQHGGDGAFYLYLRRDRAKG